MKKIIAVLASLALLLGVCLAEEAAPEEEMADTLITEEGVQVSVEGRFSVQAVLPEGYEYTEDYVDSLTYVGLLSDPSDVTRPMVYITIAYDDSYDFQRLNDLDGERLDAWIDYIRECYQGIYDDVKAEVRETGLGTVVVLFTAEENGQYLNEILTVYHGCEISAYIVCTDETGAPARVTGEQMELILQFLTDMTITEG